MKKIALFVSVLFVAGSLFAAAPVFEAKPTIEGDATLTFGVALDNPVATGFANANSGQLKLSLVNKDSDEKGGKEGEEVYGWIKLKDFELGIDKSGFTGKRDLAGNIEAKLFLGPVFVNILGADDKIDKAGNITEAVIAKTANALAIDQASEHPGLAIGLKDTSIVDLTVGVSSKYDWDAETNKASAAVDGGAAITYKTVLSTYTLASNELYVEATGGFTSVAANAEVVAITVGTTTTNYYTVAVFATPAAAAAAGATTRNAIDNGAYNFYLAASLKAVAGLTLEVAANLTAPAPATAYGLVGLGAKAGYDIAVAEGIKITPSVGFDMSYNTDPSASASAVAYQVAAGVFVSFPGDKKKVTFTKDEKEYSPGFEVKFIMDSPVASATSNMDMGVYLWDGSLIPVLDLVAAFEINALGKTGSLMGLGVNASATIDALSPFAKFTYAQSTTTVAATKLELGVDIKAITNTTFTLKYASGDLTPAAPATAGLGVITFATKIAF